LYGLLKIKPRDWARTLNKDLSGTLRVRGRNWKMICLAPAKEAPEKEKLGLISLRVFRGSFLTFLSEAMYDDQTGPSKDF